MANAGDLLAMLRTLGGSRIKLDTVARQLRADGSLPVSGHGPSAARIGPEEAARVLLANAGSTKAVDASNRLAALVELQNRNGGTLLDAVTDMLSGNTVCADELRISRRSNWAVVKMGHFEVIYSSPDYDRASDHVRTEGIISGAALEKVRALLAGPSPAERRRQKRKKKGR
jgi:hypothetical protein